MNRFRIPLSNAPSQEFSITLSGALYFLRFRLNHRMQLWTMDIFNDSKEPLAYGLVLVPGTDIAGPYRLGNLGLFFAINMEAPEKDLPVDNDFRDYGGLFYVESV